MYVQWAPPRKLAIVLFSLHNVVAHLAHNAMTLTLFTHVHTIVAVAISYSKCLIAADHETFYIQCMYSIYRATQPQNRSVVGVV